MELPGHTRCSRNELYIGKGIGTMKYIVENHNLNFHANVLCKIYHFQNLLRKS